MSDVIKPRYDPPADKVPRSTECPYLDKPIYNLSKWRCSDSCRLKGTRLKNKKTKNPLGRIERYIKLEKSLEWLTIQEREYSRCSRDSP